MQRLMAFVLIHHDTHGTRVFLRLIPDPIAPTVESPGEPRRATPERRCWPGFSTGVIGGGDG